MSPDLCYSHSIKKSLEFIARASIKRTCAYLYALCSDKHGSMNHVESYSCMIVVHSTKVAISDNTKDRKHVMFFRGRLESMEREADRLPVTTTCSK